MHRPLAARRAPGGRRVRRPAARSSTSEEVLARQDDSRPAASPESERHPRRARHATSPRWSCRSTEAEALAGGRQLPQLRHLQRVPGVQEAPARPTPSTSTSATRRTRYDVGAVVVATGFQPLPGRRSWPTYGYGRFANVISAMQMDRLLAPTRPYNYVLRPGDGKVAGQHRLRPVHRLARPHGGQPASARASAACTRSSRPSCCMGALPLADVTIYHIDIRAFGKGYDEFFEQTKAMGVRFVKGKVAKITEKESGNLIVRYEDIDDDGAVREAEHDLVVLAIGIVAQRRLPRPLRRRRAWRSTSTLFVAEPGEAGRPGAHLPSPASSVAGTATGPHGHPRLHPARRRRRRPGRRLPREK
ncbi:MAG: hypothetical protein MZV70_60160 [Desulfobacterales bacterium]|nr:hypothetical protein [Desulfobacterales bacterium]